MVPPVEISRRARSMIGMQSAIDKCRSTAARDSTMTLDIGVRVPLTYVKNKTGPIISYNPRQSIAVHDLSIAFVWPCFLARCRNRGEGQPYVIRSVARLVRWRVEVRVFCATFYSETNTFSPMVTGREDFAP